MKKPYLTSPPREDDPEEWDRYMTMSEAELDAEIERVNREFETFLADKTPLQEYRFWRRYILVSIMENRRRLRDPSLNNIDVISEMWRKSIKRSQLSLLKQREFLKTGIYPGSD